jgi:tRNA-(ms[2]io[6]A)-hydroxylase
LLCAALIEARSHERLGLLERGFTAAGEPRLASFYRALAAAEDRHAEIYTELASRGAPAGAAQARLGELAEREAEILAALPFGSRVH